MAKGKVLVTMCIGDAFKDQWRRHFADNFNHYAKRHGFHTVIVGDYIDGGPKGKSHTPHWQKLLVLELEEVRRYEQAVWIDADILINPEAPSIFEGVPLEKVGAVSHKQQYRRWPSVARAYDERFIGLTSLAYSWNLGHTGAPEDRYRLSGLPAGLTDFINTGVMVFSPEHHRAVLRQVFDTGLENEHTVYENMPLSHALLSQNLVHYIDEAFNVVYPYELIAHYPYTWSKARRLGEATVAANCIWSRAWFLHFTNGPFRKDVELINKTMGGLPAVDAATTRVRSMGAAADTLW